MSQLTVYRASAGSGKTFRLTAEYLKLILRDPRTYAHILAVTFTNKATNEMKHRILSDLYGLAYGCSSDILETLLKEISLSEKEIRERAKETLSRILHDYSRFKVETIDSFFQSILRSLAKELGLGAYLNIILDYQEVLSDSVDRLIESTHSNKLLLDWISKYIEERISEGSNWRVDKDLKDFGKTIFLEVYQAKEKELAIKLSDKDYLNKYREELRLLAENAKKELTDKAELFFRLLDSNGLVIEDFSYGKSGVAGYFLKLRDGQFGSDLLTSRATKAMEDAGGWFSKANLKNAAFQSLANTTLIQLLNETEEIRAYNSLIINSSLLSLRQINNIGLLSDIAKEVRLLNKENNRFLLADTASLLHSMLGKSDASFIYEKTGTVLNHIMIDEFQDTSHMQWDNFRPLLLEGLSQGYESLIVGDEKQSIYRWRNSDWRILNNIEKEPQLKTNVVSKQLDTNWRSEQIVVDFNNELFKEALAMLNSKFEAQYEEPCTELVSAYSAIHQKYSKKERKGFAEIDFLLPTEEISYDEVVCSKLISKVELLQEKGVRAGEIAILVRKNKYIPSIAAYFSTYKAKEGKPGYCYEIVSDEAFRLDASLAVTLLIDSIRLLSESNNPLFITQLLLSWTEDVKGEMDVCQKILLSPETLLSRYKKYLPSEFVRRMEELRRMPLYELFEELSLLFEIEKIPNQESYLFTFFDKVSEFLTDNKSDIRTFLDYWEKKLNSVTIASGNEVQGIRILSIHKSKGLEYHSVLVPYCDWKLGSEVFNENVWCSPQEAPYNGLDLLPIPYNKSMQESIYATDHKQETIQLWTDSMNLLYVALTRARANLIILCKGLDPNTKSKDNFSTISDLVRLTLITGESELLTHGYNGVDQHFEVGEIVSGKEKDTEKKVEQGKVNKFDIKPETLQVPFRSYPGKGKFRQSNQSRLFISEGVLTTPVDRMLDRGKLLHELFATIRTKKEAIPAVQKFVSDGLIKLEEKDEYTNYVQDALTHPMVQEWYSGKYRLFNECTILFKEGEGIEVLSKRPDRVMLDDGAMIVVDFKFGKPEKKYNQQVEMYCQLLREMGYQNISGYLWYVDEKRIDAINTAQLL